MGRTPVTRMVRYRMETEESRMPTGEPKGALLEQGKRHGTFTIIIEKKEKTKTNHRRVQLRRESFHGARKRPKKGPPPRTFNPTLRYNVVPGETIVVETNCRHTLKHTN